ncbi:cutinase family protein [Nocardia terpenica]|nr:cutinase family protein [Nocardia terpenica]MBF6108133.1 cutinase family protein [Nocardia terpenica]MBF6115348.1 cutinase family protein [Nocardia terpenica]MBF6122670.1 cutinase family protein [Nocardia terpenica]NQE88819.1 cutinase family protein [Nocardia terpenica]
MTIRRSGYPGRGRRPGRRRGVGCLAVLAILAVLVAVIVLLWYLLAGLLHVPKPGPPGPTRPTTQPASCPDVQLLAIPGTWESSSGDDPHNPTANPNSLMLGITNPVRQQFPDSRLDVYTVPYVAQFSNPIALPPDGQQSYNNSRSEGTRRAVDELTTMHRNCPLTTYVIAGFSQGAVIGGDVAADIGAGKGPIPADQVLGVTLIADGRRDSGPGQATEIGQSPPGVGAEVALRGLNVPGITMTGPRPGFGALADRTFTICAPGDLICDAPKQALNPFNIVPSLMTLVHAVGNPVHSLYASFRVNADGTTATNWTAAWAEQLIDKAPHPAHS